MVDVPGSRSMSARSTVSPPSPESKTPIGAAVASIPGTLVVARGATEPVGHGPPETTRWRRDREDHVEPEIVGLAQRAVQLVGVRDRVDGPGERDQRVGQGHADE